MFGRTTTALSATPEAHRGYDSFPLRLGDELRGERATRGKSLMDVQRELRIRASYIAAIEDADLSVFDSLSFVAGYVRSYARYLDLDPEAIFARFRDESGFGGVAALKPMEPESVRRAAIIPRRPARARAIDPVLGAGTPFANKAVPRFAGFEPGALGSLAVLALLAGGLAYGGWTVVQEIQRVSIAPVEEAPALAVELDPAMPAAPVTAEAPDVPDPAAPSPDALARLYRPQALEAPIMVARDAPISTIAPGAVGALVAEAPSRMEGAGAGAISASIDAALSEAMGLAPGAAPGAAAVPEAPVPPQVLAAAPEAVVLIAVRPAWVRVRSAEGDTLFEKTLEPGETWEVPVADAPATLRTGNSGAIYMAVGGQTYGPVAPGPQVVSDVPLASGAVREGYAVADLGTDEDLARVVAALAVDPAPPVPAAGPTPVE